MSKPKSVLLCLCGFLSTVWKTAAHKRQCPIWLARDKRAIYRERVEAYHRAKGLKTNPVCPDCHLSVCSNKHIRGCRGLKERQDRVRRVGIHPDDWDKILKVLAKRLMVDPETGRPVPRPKEDPKP